jgi:SmpA / OmlA family
MVRNLFLLAVLAAVLFVGDGPPAGRADQPDVPPAVDLNRLRPGMTQDEVRRLLGPPKRVARQILYRRYLEQWVYEGGNAVRIEFDCVRGKEPQILTVHLLTPSRP